MDRAILHCDCNSFFASVEMLSRPELKNVPMAVTGDPENRHGIILAKNELAKKQGVETAETIWQAKQKCRDLVCVPSHYGAYREISKKVNAIYLDYTDLVEPFSIDESFLDVTASLTMLGKTPRELADDIRRRVREEIGITVSVGVSFCRVFAKLGSDYKKPDATTVFDREAMVNVIWKLPVSDLLFVGRKTAEALGGWGIHTIGDLAHSDRAWMLKRFGEAGDTLWCYANGIDDEPVHRYGEKREVKSVGNGMTFKRDIVGEDEVRAGLSALADEVASRLREENKKGFCVQVQIKTPDFHVTQKQITLKTPTWLHTEITEVALRLVRENHPLSEPIRSLTVTVSSLVPPDAVTEQLDMFGESPEDEKSKKREQVESAISRIRDKLGKDSIYQGYYDRGDIGVTMKKDAKKKPDEENGDENK